MNVKSVFLPALGGLLIGASVFALAQTLPAEKTPAAQTAPIQPAPAPDLRFPSNARWEMKAMDWGVYWLENNKDPKKAWEKWNKDMDDYLGQGYEPFAAGIYNGSAYVNQWYVYLRRLRPAESLLGKKEVKPDPVGIVVQPGKP